ncbi:MULTISPECIES: non-hydrolyzing UDP-N-acetylglucosamine 2-epimerase [Schaalia]|uniref:non-hydrolyzing UDP-N-acetylglucosamine 2-epimerase n=1 Tax=Schaalia TaxID=2529408 RepID=UPI0026EEC09D|nr:UDP-N-acetylglucosamine 2-epimerase (non-hydrolyzing) [Schaalia hyovaginalis]MCI6411264.1 UDP-N-acetylglucosamine 2-epimerase (non-hydrolyzing) [Schaalia hyovaginalis]MCI7512992.1 UDP-N-acetylglucosamine 2-epimerase (non-hydrolyzing) [Schaalia hyovaginalis]MDY4491587.1 UDP-N-acetylglucosamine 2-epimerase (non-hydrolyzing) [Schaalia hyovaginalis]
MSFQFRETPLIMVVYGTRPEGIKVAPVIRALEEDSRFNVMTVITGQHQQMLDEVDELFGIEPDIDLSVFEAGQSLNHLAAKIVSRIDGILAELTPDALLVQGDTTSVLMAAIAAFNRQIPVVHLEAGLRSGGLDSPFPEEGNRRLVSQIARLHLAPTARSRENLIAEGVDPAWIAVTGNTVVDALEMMIDGAGPWANPVAEQLVESGMTLVTVTSHRRENWGRPLRRIGRAIRRVADERPEVHFVLPLHANPIVRNTLEKLLGGASNVSILPPLDYVDFLRLVEGSAVVVSDSGGVQEEAPSLRTPVLILRESTERPEAVESGWGTIVGTGEDAVYAALSEALDVMDETSAARMSSNPFGDGSAARRCVNAIADLTLVGVRDADFVPGEAK